ncbi:GGDEF domain-containing protein [Methylopila henanensis]|uniref:diguanylate cyclase n=1 Tax=Methylopila henanensis TaxID=873516 RepID=A0ABW4KBT5_9HYPH
MLRFVARLGVVTLIAIAMSVALTVGLATLFGFTPDHVTLIIAATCPLVISLTLGGYLQRQSDRLRLLNDDLREAHARLSYLARHDGLTGVLNHAGFYAAVDDVRRQGGALLLADADHFKQLNDHHGHAAGDRALQALARSMAAAAGPDALLGRVGGEEFAIYLPANSAEEAAAIAERVRLAVAETAVALPAGAQTRLTVSVGGATDDPALPFAETFRRADACLYEAKRAGRNRAILPVAA